MDHDFARFIAALLLSGMILFVWHYYRSVFTEKHTGSTTTVHRVEKVEPGKTNGRKDLSQYRNCGALKIVVYPIYRALDYINGKIKNPGAALIFITLLIRLLLAPLAVRQIKSSKNMAGLKDEIEKIKNDHKENPLEMQKAVGAFFREKGINPLKSIALAVIQIPVFFALYKIVREARLFSGAPLGLWIEDLGVADPYYVLPVLSGLFMLLGMKFSGNRETRMPGWLLYLFPAIFTCFLLNQPSGLALYMLVGSVFQLGINMMAYR